MRRAVITRENVFLGAAEDCHIQIFCERGDGVAIGTFDRGADDLIDARDRAASALQHVFEHR